MGSFGNNIVSVGNNRNSSEKSIQHLLSGRTSLSKLLNKAIQCGDLDHLDVPFILEDMNDFMNNNNENVGKWGFDENRHKSFFALSLHDRIFVWEGESEWRYFDEGIKHLVQDFDEIWNLDEQELVDSDYDEIDYDGDSYMYHHRHSSTKGKEKCGVPVVQSRINDLESRIPKYAKSDPHGAVPSLQGMINSLSTRLSSNTTATYGDDYGDHRDFDGW